MDLKELKQRLPGNVDELKVKLRYLHGEYGIDRVEFGKMLIIASVVLTVVSVHSVLVMDSSLEEVQNASQEMETSYTVISDSDFQSAITSLGSVEGGNIGQQVQMAAEGFQNALTAMEDLEELEEDLDESRTLYQWLVVTGVVGMVTGLAVIFV